MPTELRWTPRTLQTTSSAPSALADTRFSTIVSRSDADPLRKVIFDAEKDANLAGMYSLVASCEAHEVDGVAYLRDVLLRIETHPAWRSDDLLPDRWRTGPSTNADSAAA